MVWNEPGLSKTASLQRLKDAGLKPRTVFDVGVATGTPDLYGVFDDVSYALIEPLEESRPFMDRLVERYPGSVAIHAAAGPAPGEARLVVTNNISGSSMLIPSKNGVQRTVPVVTLDAVAEAHALQGPFLVKLDVQGYELEVLAGARQVLTQTCALICEVSLWSDRKGQGMAQLLPMLAWLSERGMALYDIATIVRRDYDNAITEMDLVFVPASSPLRADHRYKRPEQAEAAIAKRRRSFGLE